jgi:hypothetical protein
MCHHIPLNKTDIKALFLAWQSQYLSFLREQKKKKKNFFLYSSFWSVPQQNKIPHKSIMLHILRVNYIFSECNFD